MKIFTKKRALVIGCSLLIVYCLGILTIPRIPGNLLDGPAFGPRLMIYMGEGEGPDRFTNASIVHASQTSLLETIYAPFFSSAKFDAQGNPNFVAKWVFGIDFNISKPPPK